MKIKKNNCKDCANKGFYSQIFGLRLSADFDSDKPYIQSSSIYKIACPTCNFRNKRKLKGVIKSQFNAI